MVWQLIVKSEPDEKRIELTWRWEYQFCRESYKVIATEVHNWNFVYVKRHLIAKLNCIIQNMFWYENNFFLLNKAFLDQKVTRRSENIIIKYRNINVFMSFLNKSKSKEVKCFINVFKLLVKYSFRCKQYWHPGFIWYHKSKY